jgi:hypothetical protein
MILHASVVADHPKATAQTLAALLGGIALPVGPGDGTWSAIGPDPIGNLISVLARGSEFHRASSHVETRAGPPMRHSAYHLLIESPLSETAVLDLAREQGCSAHRATHGAFDVIEFWIDDCLLVEIATPELSAAYRAMVVSDEIRARLASTLESQNVHAAL